jgi:hypothetical protein
MEWHKAPIRQNNDTLSKQIGIPLPHSDLTLFPIHAILRPTEHENRPGVERTGGAEFAFYRGACGKVDLFGGFPHLRLHTGRDDQAILRHTSSREKQDCYCRCQAVPHGAILQFLPPAANI